MNALTEQIRIIEPVKTLHDSGLISDKIEKIIDKHPDIEDVHFVITDKQNCFYGSKMRWAETEGFTFRLVEEINLLNGIKDGEQYHRHKHLITSEYYDHGTLLTREIENTNNDAQIILDFVDNYKIIINKDDKKKLYALNKEGLTDFHYSKKANKNFQKNLIFDKIRSFFGRGDCLSEEERLNIQARQSVFQARL